MTGPSMPRYGEKPTGREQQIVKRLALGLSNVEIARQLGVSENTIKTHLLHVTAKLDARGRNAIVAAAYEEEWLRLPDELVLKQAEQIQRRQRLAKMRADVERQQVSGRAA
jgi:DNA-binding CsgD family transcriptional regulator